MTATQKKTAFAAAVFLLFLLVWIVWGNTALEQTTYFITNKDLPQAFDGYRIAHISDLHNAEMGEDNEELLALLQKAAPDLIAISGDLVDSRRTDLESALHFAAEAAKIAPCCYVTGNHEARLAREINDALEAGLQAAGVLVLHDSKVTIERAGESIMLLGIDDPAFAEKYGGGIGLRMAPERISELAADAGFTVLLSHRPEFFACYQQADVDLVLSGHAHGGQFRLPLIGGLFAPGQGLFPTYDAGVYTEGDTSMVVSRGIGNSIFPFRCNNRPELVLIELQSDD